jgi:hypothetical protein
MLNFKKLQGQIIESVRNFKTTLFNLLIISYCKHEKKKELSIWLEMGTHKTCNDIKFLKSSYKNDLTK